MQKKTFKQLKEIDEIYGKLLNKKDSKFAETKLGYAFKRFSEKNIKKIFTDFNDTLQDIRIDNALVDPTTKAVLYKPDGQNFQYSKEGLKNVLKRSKEITEEWETKEFEVEPFICNDIEGFEFTDEEKELLDGVIINVTKE